MRLRFTIRDLLWLTLVAALVVGWWVDRSRIANQLDAVRRQLYQERMSQGLERWDEYKHGGT